ncbi:hypothetical protein QFZ33_001899 [Arthrobacter globiformis]|nr:hypothetical protein [Arthrobacter globiformis]
MRPISSGAPVPRVGQHPQERRPAVGDEPTGHGRRNRPKTIQRRRLLGQAKQRKHRNRDQDLRRRGRHTTGWHLTGPDTTGWQLIGRDGACRKGNCGRGNCGRAFSPALNPGTRPEQPRGGGIDPQLGQGSGFGRARHGAGGGGGAVPDPGSLVRRQVRRQPGHAVPVRNVLQPPVLRTVTVPGFDADRVVPFPPIACLGPETCRRQLPGRATPRSPWRIRVQEMRLKRRGRFGFSPSVSSHIMRPCCQDNVPDPSAASVNGKSLLSLADSSRDRAADPSLTVSAPATSAVTDISRAA